MSANTPVEPAPPGPPSLQRLSWVIPATALALIAVVAVSVVTLTYIPPPPPPSPALLRYQAMQTAQARRLVQTYTPDGIGPCDTFDPPYSSANPEYWQWGSNPGDVTCPDSGVTRFANDNAYVVFYGFEAGWPPNFTSAIAATFHAPDELHSSNACISEQVTDSRGQFEDLILCADGRYIGFGSSSSGQLEGSVTPTALYKITLMVAHGASQFSVNGQTVTSFPFTSPADLAFNAWEGLPAGASVDLTQFILAPQA
jgi:hypothetical protein